MSILKHLAEMEKKVSSRFQVSLEGEKFQEGIEGEVGK